MERKNDKHIELVEKEIILSLLVLGFSKKLLLSEGQVNDGRPFKKMTSSVRESILHFLFMKIDATVASKTFRDCWPICDRKMRAEFQKNCFIFYKNLYQNEEYALKPRSLVSRDIVNPMSDKFLDTIYALCVVALRAQTKTLDRFCSVLHWPLSKSASQRRKAFDNIQHLQQFHCDHYITGCRNRIAPLQSISDEARVLIQKYRAKVEERKATREKWVGLVNSTSHIPVAQKTQLVEFQKEPFQSYFAEAVKEKNDEIRHMWADLEPWKHEDELCWRNVSALVTGGKGLACLRSDALVPTQHKVRIEEDCYIEGKLDLLKLFQLFLRNLKTSQSRLMSLKAKDEDGQRQKGIEEGIENAQNQLKCLSTIQEQTKTIQSDLDELYSVLLEACGEHKTKMDSCESLKTSTSLYSDSLELCPPLESIDIKLLRTKPKKSYSKRRYPLIRSFLPENQKSVHQNQDSGHGNPKFESKSNDLRQKHDQFTENHASVVKNLNSVSKDYGLHNHDSYPKNRDFLPGKCESMAQNHNYVIQTPITGTQPKQKSNLLNETTSVDLSMSFDKSTINQPISSGSFSHSIDSGFPPSIDLSYGESALHNSIRNKINSGQCEDNRLDFSLYRSLEAISESVTENKYDIVSEKTNFGSLSKNNSYSVSEKTVSGPISEMVSELLSKNKTSDIEFSDLISELGKSDTSKRNESEFRISDSFAFNSDFLNLGSSKNLTEKSNSESLSNSAFYSKAISDTSDSERRISDLSRILDKYRTSQNSDISGTQTRFSEDDLKILDNSIISAPKTSISDLKICSESEYKILSNNSAISTKNSHISNLINISETEYGTYSTNSESEYGIYSTNSQSKFVSDSKNDSFLSNSRFSVTKETSNVNYSLDTKGNVLTPSLSLSKKKSAFQDKEKSVLTEKQYSDISRNQNYEVFSVLDRLESLLDPIDETEISKNPFYTSENSSNVSGKENRHSLLNTSLLDVDFLVDD